MDDILDYLCGNSCSSDALDYRIFARMLGDNPRSILELIAATRENK